MTSIAALVCALAWIWGSFRSYSAQPLSPLTSALFALGAMGFMVKFSLPKSNTESSPDYGRSGLLLRAAILLAVIIAARQLLVALYGEKVYDPIGVFMFFVMRYRGAYEGIPTQSFSEWPRLAIPLAWFSLCLWSFPRLKKLPASESLLALAFLAFLGKFAIAYLNFGGLESLVFQIEAISNHYYELALKIMGHEADFIQHFNTIQPLLGTHGEAHPFGPELFYDLIIRLISPRPFLVASTIMALTSLTVIPIWGLAKEAGLNAEASFSAACLYAVSPPSLILASSGIDCVIALLIACGLWAWMIQLRSPTLRWAFIAGLIAALVSLLSQIALYLLLLYALLLIPKLLRRESWLPWLCALAIPALLHLLLWLGTNGEFRYDQILAHAASVHGTNPDARPYSIFVWANALLFLGYAGLGSAALFLSKIFQRESNPFNLVGLCALAVMILNGLGHIEIQRIYLWAYAFLFIAAAPWAAKSSEKFNTTLSLNFFSAVLLELLVLDFW